MNIRSSLGENKKIDSVARFRHFHFTSAFPMYDSASLSNPVLFDNSTGSAVFGAAASPWAFFSSFPQARSGQTMVPMTCLP